jgi:DNA-binding transcriptional LysR family regulator
MKEIDTMQKALADNLDKLVQFQAVARLSSISRAAPSVHLSQSALSHLIAKLETSVGVKLFKRRPRGLELTDEGKLLHDFTQRLTLDLESLAERLMGAEERGARSIRVGTHETLAVHIWPKSIARSTREGKLKISLLSGRVEPLIDMLLRGDLHATVTVEPKPDPRLQVTPLYRGRLRFYVGMESPMRTKVKMRDLKGVPIFTDTLADVRQGLPIPRALAQLGLENSGSHEVSSFEAAINLAAMNLGVAVIPDRNAAHALSKKRIRRIEITDLRQQGLLDYRVCLANCVGQEVELLRAMLVRDFGVG